MDSGLTAITIPSTVTYMGEGTFSGCKSLTNISFAQNSRLAFISGNLFTGTAIQTITLPNNISYIENGAFGNCASLETITIPSSVCNLGEELFVGCTALTAVHFTSTIAPRITDKTFGEEFTFTIYVPASSLAEYQKSLVWRNLTLTAE